MNPQTYTKDEAAKAIWKDLMKARRGAKRNKDALWLGDQDLEYIQEQIAGYLLKEYFDLESVHVSDTEDTMHIVTNPLGCSNYERFETHPCICWHRHGPDSFVRSEHIPYDKDSECRREV